MFEELLLFLCLQTPLLLQSVKFDHIERRDSLSVACYQEIKDANSRAEELSAQSISVKEKQVAPDDIIK